jgi:hypothetical protein
MAASVVKTMIVTIVLIICMMVLLCILPASPCRPALPPDGRDYTIFRAGFVAD